MTDRNAAEIRRLLADRKTAKSQKLSDRVASIDKHLAALGHGEDKPKPEVSPDDKPKGRSAAKKATAAAKDAD